MNKFYIMSMGTDGPSRVEGSTSYPTEHAAQTQCKKLLMGTHKNKILSVFHKKVSFWINPNPEILDDYPKCEATP